MKIRSRRFELFRSQTLAKKNSAFAKFAAAKLVMDFADAGKAYLFGTFEPKIRYVKYVLPFVHTSNNS